VKPGAKFFIQTFGCRCNQADSDALRSGLCRGSMREAAARAEADLVVINTCTVTRRTDQQVRQAVRKAHRENPKARLVVAGCYAERDPDALSALPGVSLVVGNAARDRLAEIIDGEYDCEAGRVIRSPFDSGRDFLLPADIHIGGRTRPFVKLQDGCDAVCSYCIIPSVRGPGRSARLADVLTEISALIENGYQEIVLTGVHLGTYGKKLDPPAKLAHLLETILNLPGLGRLRLSSIEPMNFSREIVDLAASYPSFAPHFHIPLQSGSNRILRLMKRAHTALRFQKLMEDIQAKLPDAALGTDLLTGFPGETDEDFRASCAVLRESPLTYAHVFPFSAREGTPAFDMPDKVHPTEIQERARILREISREKNYRFRSRFKNRVLKGITLAKEEDMGEGVVLTENYIHAHSSNPVPAPNQMVRVRIDSIEPDSTHATIIAE
jgi:threonylcarbamoyladenosine tRNA methylthiotransferase MtaB